VTIGLPFRLFEGIKRYRKKVQRGGLEGERAGVWDDALFFLHFRGDLLGDLFLLGRTVEQS
jgi:hypothetical protein